MEDLRVVDQDGEKIILCQHTKHAFATVMLLTGNGDCCAYIQTREDAVKIRNWLDQKIQEAGKVLPQKSEGTT